MSDTVESTRGFDTIVKEDARDPQPNLRAYEAVASAFAWASVREELDGLPGEGGLNIGYEAVDRHARGPLRDRVALRFLGRGGGVRELTYGELADETARFANVLHELGIARGKRVFGRVFGLLGRVPEPYVAVLGRLKARSVFCPLFPAFGPEPIRQRPEIGKGACWSRPRRCSARRSPS